MNGREAEEGHNTDINTISPIPSTEQEKKNADPTDAVVDKPKNTTTSTKKKNALSSFINFVYDPKRKTVLGRSSLNWAQLSLFYMIFYFCLGCFFVGLLQIFAMILDRKVPRYYNTESTMAVRTSATVVGMGFRPQPRIDDNVIYVSNNPDVQKKFASSLQLYRDIYLTQKDNARVDDCSPTQSADDLPSGVACEFEWDDMIKDDHPCSDRYLNGYAKEEPCVLVKLNKVYGWKPGPGRNLPSPQKRRGGASNRTNFKPDVRISCTGTNFADIDALEDIIYYSPVYPQGSTEGGIIPNYFFPYLNLRDHVQPFVLVQFKNLPFDRLISVTCKAYAPNIKHDTRGMRGMITFQLYRSHEKIQTEEL